VSAQWEAAAHAVEGEGEHSPQPTLDLSVDGHVHTGFAKGRLSVGALVTAAEQAGLTEVTFADLVGPETTWLRAYLDSVRRAQKRTDLALRVAVEVEVVRQDGWVAFPADLGELESVSIALSGVPLPTGLTPPERVRTLIRSGELRAADVTELVVEATVHAVERTSRYAPTQLARPLGILAALGIDEAEVDEQAIRRLVTACRSSRVTVEVSEAWRTPSLRLARALAGAGVPLVAASDTADASQLGRWRYVRAVQGVVEWVGGGASGPRP
jgi:histidinol phosphatase-like PHP family hydrolase